MQAVLVLSDSHGDINGLSHILQKHIADVEYVFHLGDGFSDINKLAVGYSAKSFHAIGGNCDRPGAPKVISLKIGATKIMGVHGHRHGVKSSYDRLCYAAEEAGVGLCLFGHTHLQHYFTHNGIGFLNPGAVMDGRYAIISFLDEGGFSIQTY